MKTIRNIRQILVFTLLFLSAFLWAQHNTPTVFIIKGVVADSVLSESIPYATVSALLVAKPQEYVKRLATDVNGSFLLELEHPGNYLIRFESIGMKTIEKEVALIDKNRTIDFGKILLSANSENLNEVTVVAQKPLVKTDLDKLIYDTQADPESSTSNTLDILRKVPMVTVDGDDNIQVKGSSNFKVYINGKPSNITDKNPSLALKSMPASSIKKIELITEPGAKYDADGVGGIINIVTEKSLTGYNGSVNVGVDSYGGFNGGLYFTTKIKKFGITSNVNYYNMQQPATTTHSERENYTTGMAQQVISENRSDNHYQFGNGNLEMSYEFDSLNLLSFSFGGHLGGSNNEGGGTSYMMNKLSDTILIYNSLNTNKGSWGGLNASLDYQHSFKKPEQLLTISYRFGKTPDNSDYISEIDAVKNYTSYQQRISSKASGDEHTFQIDYTEPFNKKHVLEAGAKYILRLNYSQNDYFQLDTLTDKWEEMSYRDNTDLNQTQHVVGAYGSYTLKLEKFSLRAGARLEYTSQRVLLSDTNFNVGFTNVVPTINFTYRPNATSNIRLTYNQRIRRPSIWYLNPFLDDSDPLNISQGNPDLVPEINHSLALNYGYFTQKLNMNVSLGGGYARNVIQSVSSLRNDTVVYTTYQNIGKRYFAEASVYANWTATKWMRIYTTVNGNYVDMSSEQQNLQNNGWRYIAYAGGQFTLPLELKINAYGGYASPYISLQGKGSAYYFYGLSLSRAFFQKKLNISLSAQDFAEHDRQFTGYTQTEMYYSQYVTTRPARQFRLSVNYSFGEMKEQIKKASRTIKNDDAMTGGQGGEAQGNQGGSGL